MFWKSLARKAIVVSALGAMALLGACTITVQPLADPGSGAESGVVESGAADTVAEFVLPDGTSCLFSGTGATVAFDGKRANYTCVPVDATESTTQTLAILGDPIVTGPTEYFVDLATIARTDGGFELHSSEVISFTAWQVVLADGRVCLHAGFGATMGFDDKRLNYTCDKGSSTADEVGLMGELVNAGAGVWTAQIDEIGRDANGFVQLSSNQVAVAQVSGAEVVPGGEAQATPESGAGENPLVGTTWQWVETVYGDESVVAASDPSRYTLLFDESGQVAVTFDCNGGGGTYTVDGSSLIFGAMVSTLMACPEGSQDSVFAKDLGEVYSFVIQDGHLFLSLKLDSGIMEFAPASEGAAGPTAEATEEVTAEATAEPTEEPTAEATMEPTEEATQEPTAEATEEATAEATMEPTAEATEEASEEVGSELAGTSWQWQQSVYEDDTVVASSDPSRYTLTFNADGSLNAQLDCNRGRGTFTLDGANLALGPVASTRMGCPADTQDGIFAQDLEKVVSYAFADGNLHLTLADGGVMEFAPVE